MRHAHTYRLIDSSTVMINLSPIGDKILPTTKSQIRLLPRLSPKEQRHVWQKVIEPAPIVEDKPRITAKLVKRIAFEVRSDWQR